ncbi:MAG TPA: hypothetical protein VJX70_00665 [Candidatus Acidoferrum sp.]|nr:hypothetical protein [Candidatus Acidoferrum sp.]
MSNGAPPNPAIEAYKLEYQLAASRYENIYKALWQIFSYLSAVTGALLTFGGDHFQSNFLWVLASLPLLFWYLSTYSPMNHYGDLCLTRLAGIEDDINALSDSKLKHYKDFKANSSKGFRVRHVVHVLGFLLALVFAVNGYRSVRAWCNGTPLIREKPPETKLISLSADDLKKLMQPPPTGQAARDAEPAKSISQTPAVPPDGAPAKKKGN